jgi:multiple sugar transport system permease protein
VLLLLPALLVLGVFQLYPIVDALRISFQDFHFLDPSGATWVGVDNYRGLFERDAFRRAILNTLLLLVTVVPLQTIGGFVIALMLNERMAGQGAYRTLFFLPYVTPPVAVAAILAYLFTLNGPATRLLNETLGLPNVPWYTTEPFAIVLVAITTIWMQFGFYMVLYLAGLQEIPRELYEAARIDGASPWQATRYITVPMLAPTTFLVLVMGTIATLQVFDVPYMISSLGGGVPGGPANSTMTMVMYLYREAFTNFDMGHAAAAAFVVFAGIFAMTIVQRTLFRHER